MKKKTAMFMGVLLVAMIGLVFGQGDVYYTVAFAAETTTQAPGISVTEDELDILRRIVWAEARGEDEKGMILVVNVIMNRMECPRFPNSIESVVFQPRQFSPVRNGAFARAQPCARVDQAVEQALRGRDYAQGAVFFRMIEGAQGQWHERDLTPLFDHGTHRFYDW